VSDPEQERITARVAAYGLILHGLLERLRLSGIIDDRDIDAIERFAVTIAGDLAEHGSTEAQVGGARIAEEVRRFVGAIR
jgi:hypothetical protein